VTRRRWLALAAALPGCTARKKAGTHLTVLKVGIANSSHSVAPLFLGQRQGYFRQEGLEIEVERSSFTGLHVSALAAGKLDVVLVAMNPALVNGVIHGAPVRLVSARKYCGSSCGAWGQFFARLSAFPGKMNDFRELRGKRVAYSTPGSISDFCLDAVLDAAGLTRETVETVAIRRQEAVAALLVGNLDAIMNATSLNEIPAARLGEFGFLRGAETLYPDLQVSFTAFGERLRSAGRQAGLGFLRAFRRATDDFVARRNPAFMEEWAKEQGFDPNEKIELCPGEAASDGSVDAGSVRLYVDWAARRKHTEGAIASEAMIDNSLVRDLSGRGKR
jgi:ABC-type nitrate/sulfonate/bicarbonate transport system substrate-binding protein